MTYFSRLTLDINSIDTGKLVEEFSQNAYREHQFLWQCFAEDREANRDFVFRKESRHARIIYYVVSKRAPTGSSLWSVETKQYCPNLRTGETLAFSLRANPVITHKDDKGRSKRHDVIMDTKSRTPNWKEAGLQKLISEAGIKWLKSRAPTHGFSVEAEMVQVGAYQQQYGEKRSKRDPIRFSSLDFNGRLTVSDSDLFNKCLIRGLGRSKAFGCGLLLVRRS